MPHARETAPLPPRRAERRQAGQSSNGLRILSANPPTDCCVSSAKLGARLPRELGAWLPPPSREQPPVRLIFVESVCDDDEYDGCYGVKHNT